MCISGGGSIVDLTTTYSSENTCEAYKDTLSNKDMADWVRKTKFSMGTQLAGYPFIGYNADGTCTDNTCPVADDSVNLYLCNADVPPDMHMGPGGLVDHLVPEGNWINDTILFTDLSAGTTSIAAASASPAYYKSISMYRAFEGLVVASTSNSSARKTSILVRAGGLLIFSNVQVAGSVKTEACTDRATCGWDATGDRTADELHLMVLDPKVYLAQDATAKVELNNGKVTVIGGSNAGTISISTPKAVRIGQLSNSGTVAFTTSQDIVLSGITNAGNVSFDGIAGTVHNVMSSGMLTVSNATGYLFNCNNSGTIEVTGAGSTLYVEGGFNSGVIDIKAGTVSVNLSCSNGGNTGTIKVGADVTGNITIEQPA